MECAGGRGLRGKRGMLQRGRGARVSALEPRENPQKRAEGRGSKEGTKTRHIAQHKECQILRGGPRSVGTRGAPERHGRVPCDGVARGFSAHRSNWKSNLSSNAKYCLTHTINGLYQWEVNSAIKIMVWPQSRGSNGRRWISEGVRGSAGRAENPRRVWRGAKSKWGTEGDIVNE